MSVTLAEKLTRRAVERDGLTILWVILASSLVACGGSGTRDASMSVADAISAIDGTTEDTVTSQAHHSPYCVTDPRAQPYAVGTQTADDAGSVTIRLMDINPVPPFRSNYAWTVQVARASGIPITGAVMTVRPWMPDHGHGASIVPSVTEMDEGKYVVHNLDLFMEGIWTVTFHVQVAGNPANAENTVVFTLCVGGD